MKKDAQSPSHNRHTDVPEVHTYVNKLFRGTKQTNRRGMGRAEGHRGLCSMYNTDLRENVLVSHSAVYSADVKEEMFNVKMTFYFYLPK